MGVKELGQRHLRRVIHMCTMSDQHRFRDEINARSCFLYGYCHLRLHNE